MITFTIPGAAHGKGRPRAAKRGNHITLYTPAKTASYENLVKVRADEAMAGRQPIEGAVSMVLRIFVTPPESWSQKKKREALAHLILPTNKPDADNVLKAIADACNDIVYRDDKQITDVAIFKRYDPMARVEVEVQTL